MRASYRAVLRCLLDGIQWLLDPSMALKVAGKAGISQARPRLGWKPLSGLHDAVVMSLAVRATTGAWYRGWRLVSLDGRALDVADEPANELAFGRPGSGRGDSADPQIRFVARVENGTHVLFGSRMAGYGSGAMTLAKAVLVALQKGMPGLADRPFFGVALGTEARGTGADLVWRIKRNMRRLGDRRWPDGSSESRLSASARDWRHKTNGVIVRVVDDRLAGVADAEPISRLVTSLLEHDKAPAQELAARDHQRWEIETVLDALRTPLRGAKIVLRRKTPDRVWQEFYGLMMAHCAVRRLIYEAALKADEDPDQLSFLQAVRVVCRKLPTAIAVPPWKRKTFHDAVLNEILQERVASSRNRRNRRGVKRKMSNFPLRRFPQSTSRQRF